MKPTKLSQITVFCLLLGVLKGVCQKPTEEGIPVPGKEEIEFTKKSYDDIVKTWNPPKKIDKERSFWIDQEGILYFEMKELETDDTINENPLLSSMIK